MNHSYHFIGIGGSGMSGLARLLLTAGVPVSGSDAKESDTTRSLRAAGARVEIGHAAENLGPATHVVYTAAVTEENPELAEAGRRGLEVIKRSEMLGRVMAGRSGIAIAGTHGKTTTTAMTASIFTAGGADPTVLVGGEWSALGGNARTGAGRHFITEACEAFDSFLELHPHIAVLTNVEADHLDWHGSLEGVVRAFERFLSQVDPRGYVVGCGDDPQVVSILERTERRRVLYGFGGGLDYRATDLRLDRPVPTFHVVRRGEDLGEVSLGVPGRHNVLNALAAAAVALEEGVAFSAVQDGLAAFTGVGRRFEILGEVNGVRVVDDYAHHPTEVAATLAAARHSLGRRTTVVFQPHLFSRTQLLLEEFARSFRDADNILVAAIYPAREKPIEGVDGGLLARRIQEVESAKPVRYVADRAELLGALLEESRPGDLVITMGAGDIREVGEKLVQALAQRV